MDPDGFYIRNLGSYFDNFLRNFLIDAHIGAPVVLNELVVVF